MTKQNGSADPGQGHVVLASADGDAFTSLRLRSRSRRERYRIGRELRRVTHGVRAQQDDLRRDPALAGAQAIELTFSLREPDQW